MKKTVHISMLIALFTGCGDMASGSSVDDVALREQVDGVFTPLPTDLALDMEKVLLGRSLYHDERLSGDETISCSSCHMLSHGGAEPRATSVGIFGQVGPINSPTVLNADFNLAQFWDGRAADLLEQAAGPVTNPIEMGGEWETILGRLQADDALVAHYEAVYGSDAVTQDGVLEAIVEYEKSLTTPSRFDDWLRGDDAALTEQEKRGLRTFADAGCMSCHQGVNLGGTMFQTMGAVRDYFEIRGGEITDADLGRFNVTEEDSDRHRFKVPTLRNVALTAPYFHDGNETDLGAAVQTMAFVQLGQELTDDELADVLAFLEALTGELPAHAVDTDSDG